MFPLSHGSLVLLTGAMLLGSVAALQGRDSPCPFAPANFSVLAEPLGTFLAFSSECENEPICESFFTATNTSDVRFSLVNDTALVLTRDASYPSRVGYAAFGPYPDRGRGHYSAPVWFGSLQDKSLNAEIHAYELNCELGAHDRSGRSCAMNCTRTFSAGMLVQSSVDVYNSQWFLGDVYFKNKTDPAFPVENITLKAVF